MNPPVNGKNSRTFQGIRVFFKYFSRQILFSRIFQDSPVYSSTFQACANPREQAKNKLPDYYGNVLKFRTLFFFIFSNKMLAFRAGIHNANREDPDQTVSLIWVCTVCLGFWPGH